MRAVFGFDRLYFFRNIEDLMTKRLRCLRVRRGTYGKRTLLAPRRIKLMHMIHLLYGKKFLARALMAGLRALFEAGWGLLLFLDLGAVGRRRFRGIGGIEANGSRFGSEPPVFFVKLKELGYRGFLAGIV